MNGNDSSSIMEIHKTCVVKPVMLTRQKKLLISNWYKIFEKPLLNAKL